MTPDLEITIVEIVLIRVCVPVLIAVSMAMWKKIKSLESAIMGKEAGE